MNVDEIKARLEVLEQERDQIAQRLAKVSVIVYVATGIFLVGLILSNFVTNSIFSNTPFKLSAAAVILALWTGSFLLHASSKKRNAEILNLRAVLYPGSEE